MFRKFEITAQDGRQFVFIGRNLPAEYPPEWGVDPVIAEVPLPDGYVEVPDLGY